MEDEDGVDDDGDVVVDDVLESDSPLSDHERQSIGSMLASMSATRSRTGRRIRPTTYD